MAGDDAYKCAMCRRVFTKGWSDGEAKAEAAAAFGAIPEDEQELVCDDCYQQMIAQLPPAEFLRHVGTGMPAQLVG